MKSVKRKLIQMIKDEKEAGIILSNSQNVNDKDDDESNLEKAYRKLKENRHLNEAEEEALIDFVDRAVTCTLNPELAAKMVNIEKDKDNICDLITLGLRGRGIVLFVIYGLGHVRGCYVTVKL